MKLIVKPHKKGVKWERQENAPSVERSSLVTAVRRGIVQNIVLRLQRLSARRGNRTFLRQSSQL